MNLKLLAAAIAIAALPLSAQAQQQAPKPTLAAVQQLVKSITADKAKAQAYCELGKLEEQINAAEEKKDTKTVEALGKKAEELAKKLGTEYVTIMAGLDEVDPESAEGKRFSAAMEPLEKLCP